MNQGLYNFGERACEYPGREAHWLQAKATEMPPQRGEAFQGLCCATDFPCHLGGPSQLRAPEQARRQGGAALLMSSHVAEIPGL